ncbi:hypothetical protein Cgig2_017557 [Carnegiea gigantea]|uniref:Thioredoxin domain-containing protein n=1 Tax=Carnegiea gigantea TaxID=171969 RepID=A0A9Q1QN04_9CARY|nr:hypothetical protein Cgig2_017557 [Carnegiea gigantea]
MDVTQLPPTHTIIPAFPQSTPLALSLSQNIVSFFNGDSPFIIDNLALTSENSCTSICSAAANPIYTSLSKSYSLCSLQIGFPLQLRRQSGSNGSLSLSRNQVLPQIEATKRTFSSFNELIADSDKPVLVDFYAVWCDPCQFMVPTLDKMVVILKGKIHVEEIGTEEYASFADKYNIEALPTFILLKDREPCDRFKCTYCHIVDRAQPAIKLSSFTEVPSLEMDQRKV